MGFIQSMKNWKLVIGTYIATVPLMYGAVYTQNKGVSAILLTTVLFANVLATYVNSRKINQLEKLRERGRPADYRTPLDLNWM